MPNARSISSIAVPLKTDVSGFGKGLVEASNKVDKFYAGIRRGVVESPFGRVAKQVSDLGKGFSALGRSAVAPLMPIADGLASVGKQAASGIADVAKLGGVLAGLGAAGLATVAIFARGGLKRIGEVGDVSLQLGIASDKLTELQYAAKAAGASAEDLNGFLKGLTSTVHDSVGRITPASDAFKKLGTSAEELTRLSPDQQIAAIKAGFDSLPDAAAKADAAVKIGGEAGLRLFKLLGMGAAEFEALKAKSASTGFTVKPEDLAKVQATNNAFAAIQSTVDGLVNQLTIALAPAVGYVATAFNDWFVKTAADSTFFDKLIAGFIGGLGRLADAAVSISLVFKDVFAGIASAIGSAIGWIGRLLDAASQVVPGLEGVRDGVKSIAQTVAGFGEAQAIAAAKARDAFEKSKPSDKLNKFYDEFTKATEASAKATAKNTEATKAAATANMPLIDGVAKLKQAFTEQIQSAGLTAEIKQLNELKGITIADRAELTKLANQAREAGKRDSLAEDLRESTKLPFQKLSEDYARINMLLKEGKITQEQAIRGAAAKTADSGLGGPAQLAGAVDARSSEGRSYLLKQFGRQDDPTALARQGLALTGQTNNYLGKILEKIGGGPALMYR